MESVVLLVSEEHAGRAIEAAYTLTAKSVDGSVRGAFSLAVSRMVVPPAGVGGPEDRAEIEQPPGTFKRSGSRGQAADSRPRIVRL